MDNSRITPTMLRRLNGGARAIGEQGAMNGGDEAARATGGARTTSAVTRDAARLRAMLGRSDEGSSERHHMAGNGAERHISIPLPDEHDMQHGAQEQMIDEPMTASLDDASNEELVPVEEDLVAEEYHAVKADAPTGSIDETPGEQTEYSRRDAATHLRPVTRGNGDEPSSLRTPIQRTSAFSEPEIPPTPLKMSARDVRTSFVDERAAEYEGAPAQGFSSTPPEPMETNTWSRTVYDRATSTPTSSYEARSYEPQRGGVRRFIAIGGTIVAGLGIGVLLYAGGGDLLSALFASDEDRGPMPNPAAVTERPNYAAPIESTVPQQLAEAADDSASTAASGASTQAASSPSTAAQATPSAPETRAEENGSNTTQARSTATTPASSPEASPRAERTPERATEPAASTRSQTSSTESERGNTRQSSSNDEQTRSASTTSTKKFTVQVRSTSDESEAKRIAKKLRGRGMQGVSIVESSKADGSKLYRVRFGSYGSKEDAKSAAGRAGYDDAWVISQK